MKIAGLGLFLAALVFFTLWLSSLAWAPAGCPTLDNACPASGCHISTCTYLYCNNNLPTPLCKSNIPPCSHSGESCRPDNTCCTGESLTCSSNTCVASCSNAGGPCNIATGPLCCPNSGLICRSSGTCGTYSDLGQSCGANRDCSSGLCSGGQCLQANVGPAASNVYASIIQLCTGLTQLLPVVGMLMIVGGAVTYAAGRLWAPRRAPGRMFGRLPCLQARSSQC